MTPMDEGVVATWGRVVRSAVPQNPSHPEKVRQDLNLLSGNASYPYRVSILVYSPLDPNPTRKMVELVQR